MIAQSLDLNEVQIGMDRSTPNIWGNPFLVEGSYLLTNSLCV